MLEGILSFALVVVVIFLLLHFIFKTSIKLIFKILINSLIGFVILTICNFIPGINVEINIISSLITGVFGIPGAIVIIILSFI